MYVELQCKTNFSFLRGASEAGEYVQRAAELGIPALAITDINGVYALPRAFEAMKHFESVRLIAGCELTVTDHPPVSLLARDRAAYGVMCRLLTAALRGKEKGQGQLTLERLAEFLAEPGARGLLGFAPFNERTRWDVLTDTFGGAFGGRFHISLSRYLDGMDGERERQTREIAARYGLRIVATNDVHYHLPERRELQDALTCVREGVNLRTAGFKLFPNEERYLKAPLQMRSLFKDLPDAIRATLDIAESCTFKMSELTYQYPSEWIPAGYTAQRFMEELVWKGAHERYKGMIPIEVEKQILHEFRLTEKMGYADYFLTVYDIVDYARKVDIYCQGRGSAANSMICYCLGITVIDPVKMNLLFERFISENRDEPPDIDVDFEHERREEVIQYIYNKYGRDRAAMISAVRTYQKRSAFLEMSKAVGVPVGTISSEELERDFALHAGELVGKRAKIDRLTETLVNFPRHLSIHSCGFTLSALPIIETVPVEEARMENRTICQWDKNDLDTLKLVKIDVLALGFLTVIHKACAQLGMHFWDIPIEDDPAVYDMISKGDTIGTFQIESRAQIATLPITQPRCFYDLVVEIALVRPGPNVGEMKHPYIARRNDAKNGIPYVFNDPISEKILGRTYGVPIFQEQIMKLAIEKAGFTPAEADLLRRAIAAWRSAKAVDELSGRFHQGLLDSGMSPERAAELFGYMKGFSAYGFPESHSYSFAVLSYLSAWLKHYHPAELLCGLINSQPMGFYPVDVLINDAKRHGVTVVPIHPNVSEWDARLERKDTVRMGFRNVRGLSEEDVTRIVAARAERPFESMQDFLGRTRIKRNVLETMALADVFACFGLDQRHSFWSSVELHSYLEGGGPQQIGLFETTGAELTATDSRSGVFARMTLLEGIVEAYRGLGYSLEGNAMTGLRAELADLPKTDSRMIKRQPHGKHIIYAGTMLALQRPPTANGVAFMSLEDEYGSVDLVFFKHVYEQYLHVLRASRFLIVTGKVEKREESLSVLVSSIRPFVAGMDLRSARPIVHGAHPRSLPAFFSAPTS